ncbi:MAG: hypothetical protein GY934_08995 [Gammaproteobacteria bacterium]|nr:hypothetical protein [Gammaproteobacteria bacterium]
MVTVVGVLAAVLLVSMWCVLKPNKDHTKALEAQVAQLDREGSKLKDMHLNTQQTNQDLLARIDQNAHQAAAGRQLGEVLGWMATRETSRAKIGQFLDLYVERGQQVALQFFRNGGELTATQKISNGLAEAEVLRKARMEQKTVKEVTDNWVLKAKQRSARKDV